MAVSIEDDAKSSRAEAPRLELPHHCSRYPFVFYVCDAATAIADAMNVMRCVAVETEFTVHFELEDVSPFRKLVEVPVDRSE